MKKPVHILTNRERKTVEIWWDHEGAAQELYMIGGVCWPILFKGDVEGYIILAGMDVNTKEITIFHEQSFLTIHHIVGSNGTVEYKGLAPWFNKIWARYYANKFYHHQDEITHKRYYLEILRSDQINPKPHFIEVPWREDRAARMVLWEFIKTQRIIFTREDGVFNQIEIARGMDENVNEEDHPAVFALMCMLNGLVRFPWRDPYANKR